MAGVARAEHDASIGVGTSLNEVQYQRELQISLAKRTLMTELKKLYGYRSFVYTQFHFVPVAQVGHPQTNFSDEVKTVTVQHSKVFPPGEIRLAIFLGDQYLVIDWDWVMTPEEKAELVLKKVQNPGSGWVWRRGSFVQQYRPLSQS